MQLLVHCTCICKACLTFGYFIFFCSILIPGLSPSFCLLSSSLLLLLLEHDESHCLLSSGSQFSFLQEKEIKALSCQFVLFFDRFNVNENKVWLFGQHVIFSLLLRAVLMKALHFQVTPMSAGSSQLLATCQRSLESIHSLKGTHKRTHVKASPVWRQSTK